MNQAAFISSKTESHEHSGISVLEARELILSGKIKSPALVLSLTRIRTQLHRLKLALPRAEVHYAVKSNQHPAILSEVFANGGNFDICSLGEINDTVKAGAEPSSLIHSHPIKSDEEFSAAIACGVRTFVVDNPDEIQKLRRYSDSRLKILVRFRVEVKSPAVVNLQYKFGCTVDEVLPLARMIKECGHDFFGLTFHIGSQCIHSENYVQAIEAAKTIIHQLDFEDLDCHMLDIGGGFPVSYTEPVPSIEEICMPIAKALDENIRPGIKVACEPGRFISAPAVSLISSVIGRAKRDGSWWYYLDDGLYSTFSGIVFDHCCYPVLCERDGKQHRSVLAGPTCDSFDVMYDGIMMPELSIGDLIIFPMTGAYCSVSGSRFNSLRKAEYFVID